MATNTTSITVENLRFRYSGAERPTLNGISFAIQQGEIFGFLGPSGSGKSATQKILFKLLSAYEGAARINGKEVRQWDKTLYETIGVGFELPNHYLKLTAVENLNFFRAFYASAHEPMKLLEMVGLEKDAHKKVSEFSKGMKMRLNFIRAFLHNPSILFLDEPTSGLDPVNARLVKDCIKNLQREGKTIFITTHQMHDADELCDRVAFIADGTIMAQDSPANLKRQHSARAVEVLFRGETTPLSFPLKALGENTEFLNALRTRGEIETIHSKEATLDDIFIAVTGKTLT